MEEANVYDLTAQESAWAGLPHSKLLIEAFRAIAEEQLSAYFGDRASTASSNAQPAFTWGGMVRQGIVALERDPHFFVQWFRIIFVDLNDYRRWRDESKRKPDAIAGQMPRRASQKNVQDAVRRQIESERGQGRQASQKRLWNWAKVALPGATYRRVMEAMRAVEGGKKKPGRPRKAQAAVD